jgi:hypothetical protein
MEHTNNLLVATRFPNGVAAIAAAAKRGDAQAQLFMLTRWSYVNGCLDECTQGYCRVHVQGATDVHL